MLYIFIGIVIITITVFFTIKNFLKSDARMIVKGVKLEKDGRFDDAFFAYENAVRLEPGNPDAHWRLANLAFKKGAFNRAVSEYQALLAMKKYPETVKTYDVHYNLGKSFLALESVTNAFVEFFNTIKDKPDHVDANINLGLILAGQQRFDMAIDYLKNAIAYDPASGDAHYYLGLLYAEKGDFQNAISELEKANRISPDKVETNYYLGLFYKDRRMLVDAIRRFQKVVNNTSDTNLKLDGHRLLGMCYKEQGLIDEAITNYQVAANEASGTGDKESEKDILYNLGMAYTKKGNGDKALEAWKTIEQVDRSYKDVRELILKGNNGFNMKDFDYAVNSWERIVTKEGTRLKGAGLFKSNKRFDVDRVIRDLGGNINAGVDLKKSNTKSITDRFLELNNKQFFIVSQQVLKILGFTIQKTVQSSEDSDFEEGKAVAFVAARKDPKSRKIKSYLIQIRRWKENVGPIPIGNCLDMMQELGLENSLFFVSSLFTDAAMNISRRDGRIQLIDRRGMIKVLKKVIR